MFYKTKHNCKKKKKNSVSWTHNSQIIPLPCKYIILIISLKEKKNDDNLK